MKKICYSVNRDQFWENYWEKVGHDVDRLSDATVYPLFPIDRYVTKESKMLEAGCGLGRVLKHYFYQGYDIQGIEYNAFCCRRLKEEDPNLPVLQASIADLPYATETFDIVMAFGVIGHLENEMENAFREAYRVLKPNGLLAASLCPNNLVRNVFDLVNRMRHGKENKYFYTWLFRRGEIRKMLRKHGFELLSMYPVTTKAHLFMLPFFRKKQNRDFTYTAVRDAEHGYSLNVLGNVVYSLMNRVFHWSFAYTLSFVARKTVNRRGA